MKMDSPYFFYNREHIEDSQPENRMEPKIVVIGGLDGHESILKLAKRLGVLVMTQETMDAIQEHPETKQGLDALVQEAQVEVIVMDSLSMHMSEDQLNPLRTMVVGTGFHAALSGLRGLGKSIMRDAVIRHSLSLAYGEPEECWYGEDKYNNWKDFIQNPARPGRQIKKQKPPKQSFKAQMRSVNRNR